MLTHIDPVETVYSYQCEHCKKVWGPTWGPTWGRAAGFTSSAVRSHETRCMQVDHLRKALGLSWDEARKERDRLNRKRNRLYNKRRPLWGAPDGPALREALKKEIAVIEDALGFAD